jgi:ribosomal protein L37AE/L43A
MSTANVTSPQQKNPPCPECGCKNTVKKGKRQNQMRTLQIYSCSECLHRFTGDAGKNKTYPLHLILEAISTFNLGYSLTDTQGLLRKRFHRTIPERTLVSWLSDYKPFTTYARLRSEAKKLFAPDAIVRTINFHHQQVYRHQTHRAKLEMLLNAPTNRQFAPLAKYVADLEHNFPNELFRSTEHRSSKFPANIQPAVSRKENHATRIAALVLPTAPNNRKRHETLQHFMLVNDSVTVAVEIPVFLTKGDIEQYRSQGFDLRFETAIVTGHIDFLQIRNGHIHILDYKPEARKEKHAHVQLTVYALALARRTGLPLRYFKCGWFDEKDYFEFFPLTGVYPRKMAGLAAHSLSSSSIFHGASIKVQDGRQNPNISA